MQTICEIRRAPYPYRIDLNPRSEMHLISQRLASIEDTLKALTSHSGSSPRQSEPSVSSLVEDLPASGVPVIDGDSSFEAQTILAGEAANRTVAEVFGNASTVQLKAAISSLITSLEAHNLDSRAHEAYLSSVETVNLREALTLPPADVVSAIVKRVKGL
ncbi:hypothetical protein ANO11243_033640 [Dothideomycetidae sp. 11243]|nr:hypothetical protein ANO11243_033640 [fungal sp. No.11243]